MFVKNYLTDEDFVEVAVCDVCELPFEEEMDHGYHIHNACYWGLEIHAPGNKETLESLGFKEYIVTDFCIACEGIVPFYKGHKYCIECEKMHELQERATPYTS